MIQQQESINMDIPTKEQISNLLNHLYWFYNADMSNVDNQKDFKETIEILQNIIKDED